MSKNKHKKITTIIMIKHDNNNLPSSEESSENLSTRYLDEHVALEKKKIGISSTLTTPKNRKIPKS